MHDRHLRSEELDILLDEEDGFETAALRQHVRGCPECHRWLASSRKLLSALDSLPEFAPSPDFADRVMSEVHVFEPWHTAALDTVKALVPVSRPARIAASVGAVLGIGVGTAVASWLLQRIDMAVLVAQVGVERVHGQLSQVLADLSLSLLGEHGMALARSGSPETATLMASAFLAAAALGVITLRAMVRREDPDRLVQTGKSQ